MLNHKFAVTAVQAEALPEGWRWSHFEDGRGVLMSPTAKYVVTYGPVENTANEIVYLVSRPRYKRSPRWATYGEADYNSFFGTIDEFVKYAEKEIVMPVLKKCGYW